jgi:hypothetical protein
MHHELADHLALLAAPIYAAMLVSYNAAAGVQTPGKLAELRLAAITQAVLLRKETLETSYSGGEDGDA